MLNYLITGGTDGIGRAVALDALAARHRVVVVGTAAKGEAFLRAAGDAADRAAFFRADLRLISENRRVLAEARERFDRLDRLVLCAQRYRTPLIRTAEGLEENFALSCLSRHVLGTGLAPLLELLERPPSEPLSAYRGRCRIPVAEGIFTRFYDPADAERLREQAAGLPAASPA